MYQKQSTQESSASPRSKSGSKELKPSGGYGSLSEVVQKAQREPSQVGGEELQQLDSAVGTRATGEMLARGKNPMMEFKGLSTQLWGNRSVGGVPIQTKLTIGEVGDKYEQEADRVAASVVQQINRPAMVSSAQGEMVQGKEQEESEELRMKPMVQRKEAMGGGEASADLSGAIKRARGGGQPLNPRLQQSMGQAIGADFSGVRVHTDAQADQLNSRVGARAFTTGPDIFFKRDAYQPGSMGGQKLIAHELTHVVQQKGRSRDTRIQREPDGVLNPNVLLERVIAAIRDRGSEEEAMGVIDESFNQYSTADMRMFYKLLPENLQEKVISDNARTLINEIEATEKFVGKNSRLRIVPMSRTHGTAIDRELGPSDKILSERDVKDLGVSVKPLEESQRYYMTDISKYPYISMRMLNLYDFSTRENKGEKDKEAWSEYVINDDVLAQYWLPPTNNRNFFGIYISKGGLITPVFGQGPLGGPATMLSKDKKLGNGNMQETHPLHVGTHMTKMSEHPDGHRSIHKHFLGGDEWRRKVDIWLTKAEDLGGFLNGEEIARRKADDVYHNEESWTTAYNIGKAIRKSLGLRIREKEEKIPVYQAPKPKAKKKVQNKKGKKKGL